MALFLVVLIGLYAVVLYNGPRMRVQQHIRAFQAILPAVPPGTVTTDWPDANRPVLQIPVTGSMSGLERGRVYYHYYCVFCHGEKGDGRGPVGQSYVPVPANLTELRIRQYNDTELLRAMLTGNGHEPVLKRVVDPQHVRDLAVFVRSLGVVQ
nr:cytochrome C [Pelotalea chapellei]